MGNYQIIYNGIMLAMDKHEVTSAFAALFRLTPEKAAGILSRPKAVLRGNLDAATADIYREKLIAIGLDVDVRDVSMLKQEPVRIADTVASPAMQDWTVEPVQVARDDDDAELAARYQGNRELPFEFHGDGFGYFRVWIVNVLLMILTLGVYSAWAKVRTQQYFYGNTKLADASFQYLATPAQILQGRMIGFALLVFYLGAQEVSTTAALVALSVLLLLTPAMAVVAFASRLRFTAWRHITFGFARDFTGAYQLALLPVLLLGAVVAAGILAVDAGEGAEPGQAVSVLLGVGMLGLSLGFPYWQYAWNRFLVTHAAFGREYFGFAPGAGAYYKLHCLKVPALALLILLPCLLVMVIAAVAMPDMLQQLEALSASGDAGVQVSIEDSTYAVIAVAVAMAVVGGGLLMTYTQACLYNLRYQGMSFGKSVLACNVRAWPLLWLYVSNTFAILASMGLLIPWAKVRMVRYRLSCLTLHASYDLDDVVSDARRGDAIGQEVSDIFDIDIAL